MLGKTLAPETTYVVDPHGTITLGYTPSPKPLWKRALGLVARLVLVLTFLGSIAGLGFLAGVDAGEANMQQQLQSEADRLHIQAGDLDAKIEDMIRILRDSQVDIHSTQGNLEWTFGVNPYDLPSEDDQLHWLPDEPGYDLGESDPINF